VSNCGFAKLINHVSPLHMEMPLQLDSATERAVDELVDSGAFKSREAVLREGVRMVEVQQAHIIRSVKLGIADLDRGVPVMPRMYSPI
jgi:Arc/MetJ-type ribon-helix-helix transcriptional regulator